MSVTIINPLKDHRWDDFVLKHELGTLFHMSFWCEILMNTFGCKPYYVIVENQHNEITAGLPIMLITSWLTGNRLISLPRTSYCDPLISCADEMRLIVNELKNASKINKSTYFELKPLKNSAALESLGLKQHNFFVNQVLFLGDSQESLWKRFHRSCVQQRISRAEKEKVSVRFATSLDDVRVFYALHKKTTDDHSVPPRPLEFFNQMWALLYPKNLMMLGIAEVEGKAAAAGLFLQFKNILHYEFVGIDYTYSDKSPAHLLLWETIKVARERGIQFLDFGLTPIKNKGLISYKKRWGAEEKPLYYYYFPDIKGYKAKAIDASTDEDKEPNLMTTARNKLKKTIAGRMYKHFG